MSVPPDMLARLQKSQAPELPGGGQAGPAGAPMSAPQKKDGERETARVKIHVAINMLEAALPAHGAESKEGKVILSVLSKLANTFGDSNASDLVPAELMEAVKNAPQMGGGGEMQKKLAALMRGGGQQPQPMPGGGAPRMPPMQ